jgi:hypothetical protein
VSYMQLRKGGGKRAGKSQGKAHSFNSNSFSKIQSCVNSSIFDNRSERQSVVRLHLAMGKDECGRKC